MCTSNKRVKIYFIFHTKYNFSVHQICSRPGLCLSTFSNYADLANYAKLSTAPDPAGGAYNSPPEPLVGLILFGRFAPSIRVLLALNVKAQLFYSHILGSLAPNIVFFFLLCPKLKGQLQHCTQFKN